MRHGALHVYEPNSDSRRECVSSVNSDAFPREEANDVVDGSARRVTYGGETEVPMYPPSRDNLASVLGTLARLSSRRGPRVGLPRRAASVF